MRGHQLEVADVFRKYGSQFLQQHGGSLSIEQKRAFNAIVACRTPALGGHLYRCDHCAHELLLCNSCHNRHCPKCHAMEQADWMEARASELLPIPYFHVVVTLPHDFGPLALQNKRIVYGIFMRAAAQTIHELAADPKHLGADIGVTTVLHTWGQRCEHHVHVHCICTGGGISPDGARWVSCKRSKKSKKEFFVHHEVLALKFRGKFIAALKQAYRKGQLSFHGQLSPLNDEVAFERFLDKAVSKKWVTYIKRPFGEHPELVLKYLARYTHRVAISSSRLIAIRDGRVHFRYKDYRDGCTWKTTSLEGTEFIRRFLLHVLPSGFMKIRHSGILANCHRKKKLALCRVLLGVSTEPEGGNGHEQDEAKDDESAEVTEPIDNNRHPHCPKCKIGRLKIVKTITSDAMCGPDQKEKPNDCTIAQLVRPPPALVA
jgi:hypothetical protein